MGADSSTSDVLHADCEESEQEMVRAIIWVVSVVAILGGLAVLAAGPGTRFGLWDFRVGLGIIQLAAIPVLIVTAAALVSLGLAVWKARRLAPLAVAALLVAGGAAVVPLQMKAAADANPFIHDITTDFDSPPAIVAAASAARMNPVDYLGDDAVPGGKDGLTVSKAQTAAFPDIAALEISGDPAAVAARAESVIAAMGMEIIRGAQTDDETLARAYDYVQALGKLPLVVNDSRGFYTSRTFGTFVMEGAAMLGEGIPAPVIENLAMQVGMPVGPLAVLDETALSLSVHVLDQTREDFAKEGKTHTATPGELLVERMVKELKRPGRAAGGGFYDYPAGQKKVLWPELKTRFEKADVAYSQQDIKDRLLYRQAVETARCLQEGVLTSVHDGNIGSIFGIGFPAWTGGALQFRHQIQDLGLHRNIQRRRGLVGDQ
jgi:hypothetical protein